jgi:type I restriction enzyme R subunit
MCVSLTHVSRRNLPHWRREGAIYWVTFRLADSLPQTKLSQLRTERDAWLERNPEPWTLEQQRDHDDLFGERVQQWLDAGYGSCALARPEIREGVRACLTRFDGNRLDLHAAVIMPNHVHALLEPREKSDTGILAGGLGGGAQTRMSVSRGTGIPAGGVESDAQTGMSVSQSLASLLKGIKGASARTANRLLGQTGTFWMDESYDRIVRSSEEYHLFAEYIRSNPAKAQLREDQYWLLK